jgi:hypothetical protein
MPAVVKAASLMPLRGEKIDSTLILRDFCLSWWERLAQPVDFWMGGPLGWRTGLWRQQVRRWSDFAVSGVIDVPMSTDCDEVAAVQLDESTNWNDWSEKVLANPSLSYQRVPRSSARAWRVHPWVGDVERGLPENRPTIELTLAEEAELFYERSNIDPGGGGNGFAFCDASLQRSGYHRGEYNGIVFSGDFPPWSDEEMRQLVAKKRG